MNLLKLNSVYLDLIRNEPQVLERNFKLFIMSAWPVIEPTPFVDGFHIDAIAEHLQAIADKRINQLIINIPPRHGKSLITSVLWPAWEWTIRPENQYLCATYAQRLTVRDALKMRRLIMSEWYQKLWGDSVQITLDQWAKTRFENTAGGYRVSTSVGGIATGEGGNRIIIDDPHNVQDTNSDVKREDVLNWHDDAIATRDNDPKNFARVLVMQRIHQNDLTGHLLDKGGWEHLVLPMEYEGAKYFTSIGWQDERKHQGQILWPERFTRKSVNRLKLDLGSAAAGQLQQRPASRKGNIFLREWFAGKNRVTVSANVVQGQVIARWIFWDTALKDGQHNDYSAFAVLELLEDYRLFVRHIWKAKIQTPELVYRIADNFNNWNKDSKLQAIVIEDKGSGTTSIQSLQATLPEEQALMIKPFMPVGSKTSRARTASIWIERNCLLLPDPENGIEWLFDFEEDLFTFPNAKHDDTIDAFVMGILYLDKFLEQGYKARMGYYD